MFEQSKKQVTLETLEDLCIFGEIDINTNPITSKVLSKPKLDNTKVYTPIKKSIISTKVVKNTTKSPTVILSKNKVIKKNKVTKPTNINERVYNSNTEENNTKHAGEDILWL